MSNITCAYILICPHVFEKGMRVFNFKRWDNVWANHHGWSCNRRIQDKINQIEQKIVPTGTIDITHFRDDIEIDNKQITQDAIEIDADINDKVVIIIDDVLYTGRTVRASLDAILLHSRPIKIGLAALVDRGHRELPIRADFVGKNIPTSKEESVLVYLNEKDSQNAVIIE